MINQYLQQTDKGEVKNWLQNHLVKYLLKGNEENLVDIEHIIDYLNSDECPKKLFKMCYQDVLQNANKWNKKLQKKGKHIIETEEDIEVVYKFKDGMKLVKLIGESAFKREGFLMSHCVSSYYNKSDVNVYSLRDVNENPHCTLEVMNESVNQIKGKGNGHIHPKYIKYIIQLLEKFFEMDIRDSEMENLGYVKNSPEVAGFIEKYCKNSKYLTFKGNKYFYKNSKLEVKKKFHKEFLNE